MKARLCSKVGCSREAASAGVYEWRHRNRTADDIAEDAALDGVSSDGAASDHETAPREAP